jgi:muramidase (phage lysozyme)
MADLNQEAQELAEIMERVNEEMRRYGRITEETAEALKAGSDKRAKELQASGKATADALGAVAKAAMGTASAMYRGEKGAAAFNSSLDSMAEAATAAGVALTFLIPGGPAIKLLVGAVTAATGALVAYTKAANEMADKLYKGYSGLAKSGAAASDGMTGLFNDAKKLGLSMNELDGFVSLVGENSKDLVLFGGTVFEGRKKFVELGSALEGSREEFFRLGLSQEEQNKAIMGYTRLQTQLGRTQALTTTEMAEAAKKYIYEQDALTKLTGTSREEAEKQREEIRSQERFRAKLLELEQQGRHQEAKELENAYLALRSQSKDAAQGFADISTNNVQTEAAQKSIMATQGESMRVAQMISEGAMTGVQGFKAVGQATEATARELGATMGQIGTFDQTFGSLNDALKLGMATRGDVEAQYNKIIEDQNKIRQKQGDDLVNNQGKLLKTQQEANAATEQFVFKGIAPAQSAMITLAAATRDAAGALDDMTGKKRGYGQEGTGSMGASLAATGAGAAAGAIIGSVVPVIGTAVGGAIGGALGFLGYEKFGGGETKKAATDGAQKEAGRATGSLGAVGKLIEDFGKGTPMTLHGREGVITEKQLKQFGETAMNMGRQTVNITGNLGGRAKVLGQPDEKINEFIKQTREVLDDQVDIEKESLDLKEDELDFEYKQKIVLEMLAKQEQEQARLGIKQQKDFNQNRDELYDDILSELKKTGEVIAPKDQAYGPGGILGSIVDKVSGAFSSILGGAAAGAGGGGGGGGAPAGGGGGGRAPAGGGGAPASRRTGVISGASPASAGGGGMAPDSPLAGGGQPSGDVVSKLLDYIGKKESNGNYNILVGGKTNPDLTSMTVGEVLEFQKQMIANGHESTAVGKYQIINGTLRGLVKQGFADVSDKFDSSTQDKLAVGLLKRRGLDDYMSGKMDANAFADRLSMEWASLPYHTGQSYYAGVGSNKAGASRDQFMSSVFARDGGIFSGPTSGYPATLHGTEAVIPLKDGNVSAEIPRMDALIEQNEKVTSEINGLREDMNRMISELTRAMTENKDTGIQQEMLAALASIARSTNTSAGASERLVRAAAN